MAVTVTTAVTRSYVIPVADYRSAEFSTLVGELNVLARVTDAYAGLVELEAVAETAEVHEAFATALRDSLAEAHADALAELG